jgi:hypothetical protein
LFGVCATSVAGTAAADAPPTIENVNPAAPRTGTDFGIRFFFEACFTRGISHSSIPWKKWFESSNTNSTPGKSAMQDKVAWIDRS